jgi:hypothetical protein
LSIRFESQSGAGLFKQQWSFSVATPPSCPFLLAADSSHAGREIGLPLSTEELARQLKAKGYKVMLEM